jgi:bacteriocin-like protein
MKTLTFNEMENVNGGSFWRTFCRAHDLAAAVTTGAAIIVGAVISPDFGLYMVGVSIACWVTE